MTLTVVPCSPRDQARLLAVVPPPCSLPECRSYAFWLGRPWLFKTVLDAVLLFNCVYLALFACYYLHFTLNEHMDIS